MKIKIVGLLGRSGTGKNTVADCLKAVMGDILHMPLITTSRPKRPNEEFNREYKFISRTEAERECWICTPLWQTCFNDWYYYLSPDQLKDDKINLIILNPAAAVQMMNKYKDVYDIHLYELTLPDKHLWVRLASRPDLCEAARRWPEDIKDFSEEHYLQLPITHIENKTSIKSALTIYNEIKALWAE